ncbi:hypothetical protein [Bacillus sp. NPDC077027]|uniref:hypothetical protein n=1 Tax=Bacillus sp. NPDC077027 TaxID=3390548 RepID=UPI003D050441
MNAFTKQIIMDMLKTRKNMIFILIVFILQIYSLVKLVKGFNNVEESLVLVHHYFFNTALIPYFVIPFFIFCVGDLLEKLNKLVVFTRLNSKKRRIQKNVIIISMAIFYTLLLNSGFFIYISLVGINHYNNLIEGIIVFLGLILSVLGMYLIGKISILIGFIMMNKFLSFLCIYLLLILPEFIKGVFYSPIYSYIDYIFYMNLNHQSIFMDMFFIIFTICAGIIFAEISIFYLWKRKDLTLEKVN